MLLKLLKHILNNILEELDEASVINIPTTNSPKKPWYKYTVAASVTALIFACTSYLFYNQSQKLAEENQVVVDEIFDLRSDIEQNNQMLDNVMRQLLKLNNPETAKYIINGNERAKELKNSCLYKP